MSEYSFTYRNDSFSLAKAHDASLFIKAGKGEFSLLITGADSIWAWKDKCSLTDLVNDQNLADVISSPFKKVVVGLIPDALTLVPLALFNADNTVEYARFLDVRAEDRIFAGKLDDDNHIVYKVDHTVADALAGRFGLQDTVPAYRGWLAALAKSEPSNYSLYIDISCDQITIVNFKDSKVRFYNSFKITDVNDTIYYALFVARQLDLQPDYSSVVISGNCPASDLERLTEFFRIVKYNDQKLVDVPMGVPSHHILSLAALS